jgi:hypothetical protein
MMILEQGELQGFFMLIMQVLRDNLMLGTRDQAGDGEPT